MVTARVSRISTAHLFETWMVVDGSRDPGTIRRATDLLERANLEIEPVTELHVLIARDAFQRFGKGSGHGARLNFGDCFAYAFAKATGEPLLFVGDDFSRTDIPSAIG
jgi:ribonuclease VapC